MIQSSFLTKPTYPSQKVRLLPLKETPGYRVYNGPDDCGLTELLAVIVGGAEQVEIAERLIARFGTVRQLAQAHADELAGVKGVGPQTALRVKAALALGRKLLEPEAERPVVHSPADAVAILIPRMALLPQEHFYVLTLDTRNRMLGLHQVYHGSLNAATIRIGEVYRPAIQQNAAAILVAHGHPSGDPHPSPEDVSVTRALCQAGKLMDIELIDHLILGHERWVSLKEKGLGFA